MILTVQKLFHHVSHTLFKFHLDPKATSEDLYIRDPHQVATRKEIKHCHHVPQVLSSKQVSGSNGIPHLLSVSPNTHPLLLHPDKNEEHVEEEEQDLFWGW
ncbi:putative WRKY transcription factor 3 [Dorcoceras hygrometricum]|uniref:Putative WRKY transcription factor 3 n=1 Tax=Dorcoceras hygrometricum TaxID=472368 RepID=A0A2Z7A7I0_9LAMI|nr:putative WRKY transcription factor 3 [Dorcoceras hygrometricum]